MPSIVTRKGKDKWVEVPSRQALALQPELLRSTIPPRVTLDTHAQPFSGEIREEDNGQRDVPGAGEGQTVIVVLATLRRPWNFVSWAIDPRALGGAAGVSATLRVLTRIGPALLINPPPVALAGTTIQAATNYIVGAPCELVIISTHATGALGVRGSIWGMSEK